MDVGWKACLLSCMVTALLPVRASCSGEKFAMEKKHEGLFCVQVYSHMEVIHVV